MKMRNLLGLLAIGGVIVYAQKKRGGEISIEGFKRTARELLRSRGMGQGRMGREDDALESRGSRGSRRGEETSGYASGSSSRRSGEDVGFGGESGFGGGTTGGGGGFGGGGMGGGGYRG